MRRLGDLWKSKQTEDIHSDTLQTLFAELEIEPKGSVFHTYHKS